MYQDVLKVEDFSSANILSLVQDHAVLSPSMCYYKVLTFLPSKALTPESTPAK